MHRMMLRDEMLVLEAQRLIREERLNAEWAVKRAVRKIKSAFHEQADEYFKERRADVDYVGERIIKNLLGQAPDVDEVPPEGAIVVAHDLSPADTALLLHERKVAAFVTDAGAKTSHTAIVARALEVPAVVGVGRITALVERGDWIVVDGSRGVVVINPTPGERAEYEAAQERYRAVEAELLRTKDLPARTQDDVTVRVAGNIEFVEEVPSLLSHGGEAVGLYRTEFLFLGRPDLPTEEEHYQNYRRVLEALAGTSSPRACASTRRTRPSGSAPSATACASRTCSAPSSARCCAPPCTGTSRSCSRWSRASPSCAPVGAPSRRRGRSSTARASRRRTCRWGS
jgi:phosphotransferase system enzyme I (PtsI)